MKHSQYMPVPKFEQNTEELRAAAGLPLADEKRHATYEIDMPKSSDHDYVDISRRETNRQEAHYLYGWAMRTLLPGESVQGFCYRSNPTLRDEDRQRFLLIRKSSYIEGFVEGFRGRDIIFRAGLIDHILIPVVLNRGGYRYTLPLFDRLPAGIYSAPDINAKWSERLVRPPRMETDHWAVEEDHMPSRAGVDHQSEEPAMPLHVGQLLFQLGAVVQSLFEDDGYVLAPRQRDATYSAHHREKTFHGAVLNAPYKELPSKIRSLYSGATSRDVASDELIRHWQYCMKLCYAHSENRFQAGFRKSPERDQIVLQLITTTRMRLGLMEDPMPAMDES